MASRIERLQSDVRYCHQCFDWVIGEEWEPHCQSHLAGMATRRCGTITYCHTLVRPGYCPFCISETTLPASKRLESWTRDHKLWSHVNEHLEECRWPRECPHPLCDTSLRDAAALQFHFVDEHGFSRTYPVKSANLIALSSQDEKTPLHKDTQDARLSRKRKSFSCTRDLEWMPPQYFHDTPAYPGEPSPCHRQKQSRRTPPAICPTSLTLDENFTDSVTLSPPYLPSTECDLFPFGWTPPHDSIDPPGPENNLDDTLFDQFLRLPSPSPSPPPSPDDAASELSGVTLLDAERRQSCGSPALLTETLKSPAPEDALEAEGAQDQKDTCRVGSGPRVRLRVKQPKITLHLKVQDTSQLGKNKVKGTKREKARKGIKRGQQKNRTKEEEKGKGKRLKRVIGRR